MNHEWQNALPSLEDMDQALKRLDAQTFTMLTIRGTSEQHMTIGGGRGRYVVYATFDGEEFWNLLSTEPKDGTVLLNVGGQNGDYAAERIVNLELARIAGQTFFVARQLDSRLRWDRQ